MGDPGATSADALLPRLGSLSDSLGTRLWVVGGWVRDRLLSRASADLDLVIEGEPRPFIEALTPLFGHSAARLERKGIVTWRIASEGGQLDLTSCPSGGLDQELRRRDVTINAMAAPVGFRGADMLAVVDPLGGYADLRARRVRATSAAALEDDPLRMLRVIRLSVVLDFMVDLDTLAIIDSMPETIASVAVERTAAEMGLILASGRGAVGLRLMQQTGLLAHVLPFLAPLAGLAQNRWHDHDVLEHTLRTCGAAERLKGSMPEIGLGEPVTVEELQILMWAALLHDAGKAATAAPGEDGEMHFHGHEIESAGIAARFLQDFRIAGRIIERVTLLVRNHLRLILLSGSEATERAIRRLVHATKEDTPLLCRLALADLEGAGGKHSEGRRDGLRRLVARVMAVTKSEGARVMAPPPLLSGEEVMEILGLAPGPRVGAVIRWLTRLQVDQRIATRDEAVALLRSLPPNRLG